MPQTKRKSYDRSDPFVASDSASSPPPPSNTSLHPSKRTKQSTSTTNGSSSSSSSIPKMQKDTDGNAYWALSTARRVTISDFKGKKMVSVREYYQKDGAWLPGKKGITMTLEQYGELLKVVPSIERALGDDGKGLPRPVYDAVGDGEDDRGSEASSPLRAVSDEEREEEEKNGGRKANIEATSDEDED